MDPIDDSDGGDERNLLTDARAGDEGALERLLAPHWCGLKLFCGLMLGDAEAADRAMAEIVLTAQCEADGIESATSVRMWIHHIAAHVCCQAIGDGPVQNDQPSEAYDRRRDDSGVNGADEP